MSPRAYRLGQRLAASAQTREKALAAAERLLAGDAGKAFSMEAVAREAGVARMTLYHQFGSRAGLIDAFFEDLAIRGGMYELPTAFHLPDARAAMAKLIEIILHFWDSSRAATRRVHALGTIDPEIGEHLAQRQERRRLALTVLVQRLHAQGFARELPLTDTVDVLFTLTSFESFDALAAHGRDTAAVQQLILAAVGALVGASLAPDAPSPGIRDNHPDLPKEPANG